MRRACDSPPNTAGPGAHGPPASRHRRHETLHRLRQDGLRHGESRSWRSPRSRWRRTTPGRAAGFDAYVEKPISVRAPGPTRSLSSSTGPAMSNRPLTVLAVDDEPTEPPAPGRRADPARLPPRARDHRPRGPRPPLDLDVDLVLLDLMMPGLNGHEVCRRIRSDERTAFLPVVMITASGPEERLTALEAGADDFVTKPFDSSELLARVASLARLKRYHDTIETQAAELARVERRARATRRGRRGRARADQPAAALPRLPARRGRRRRRRAARQPSARDHRRLLRLPRLHLLRRDQRARGGDGRAARLPRSRRRARRRARGHPGAFHRRRRDGLLQRPGPLRRPGRPGGPALPRRSIATYAASRRAGDGRATS